MDLSLSASDWSQEKSASFENLTAMANTDKKRLPWPDDDAGSSGIDRAFIDDVLFPGNADSDGDGMPDGWEYRNGLDYFSNDAMEDPDNDLLCNIKEFEYHTDPFAANSLEAFGLGIDAADYDTDGKDISLFIEGINQGVFNPSDVRAFAKGFGR